MKGQRHRGRPRDQAPAFLSSVHALPVLATLAAVALAALLGWGAWQYYMGAPWTRDGAVRAYVVKVAPQVAGEIVSLPVADNQFVHKGDLLMLIDPRNYSIAVRQAQASVEQAQAVADNARAEMIRREKLNDPSRSPWRSGRPISARRPPRGHLPDRARESRAERASISSARRSARRSTATSPIFRPSLETMPTSESLQLSVVNSNSYWVDAYFEETSLSRIHEGDAATSQADGIHPVAARQSSGTRARRRRPQCDADASGLASVNPIFTFVRSPNACLCDSHR